jgi:Zn-dependent peptidase ImmA (M78 family)
MNGAYTYSSQFLPNVTIMIVTDEYPQYEDYKPIFQKLGYGFMIPNKDIIVIDGEVLVEQGPDDTLFKFIEAHEVAHILLNHDGPRNEQEEIEADLGAYLILNKWGYKDAIKMLLKNFKFRHGVKFDEKMLDSIKNRLQDI